MGGGDIPEDVVGALEVALGFSHQSPTLSIFMVCDAPCHGNDYHECRYDDHPEQPKDYLEKVVERFNLIQGTEAYFTVLQLNESTDIMYTKMAEAFGPNFRITEKVQPKDIFEAMFASLTETIDQTRLSSKTQSRQDIVRNP